MLAKVYSATTIGLDGVLIEVEVDVANRGFPTFTIVGLPDKAVDEAKDRVRTAITNSGFDMPDSRITVNLAPADIPKGGSAFDLPIAIGILAATGAVETTALSSSLIIGELSLEACVKPTNGIISVALLAKQKQIDNIFVPEKSGDEAACIANIHVYPVATLRDLVSHLNGTVFLHEKPVRLLRDVAFSHDIETDFAHVQGQEQAKRALEIAASGFHNIHLKGPPGAGKTLLCRSFEGILPALDDDELFEVSKIYSVAGILNQRGFVMNRPFRAPHHTSSRNGLVGGGAHPNPGEVTLAHRGVLFLDEFAEFPHSLLESLRQPLEDGIVTISRAAGSLTFPCRFLLLAASNPCPCGFFGHPTRACKCMPYLITKYQKRISGPLLDRIDLHLDVRPVDENRLSRRILGESSMSVRSRVIEAHYRQTRRFAGTPIKANSQMSSQQVRKYCQSTPEAENTLKMAIRRFSLSARAYFKLLKVSLTISDLAGKDVIDDAAVSEALQYRQPQD